jgi:citrate synthase
MSIPLLRGLITEAHLKACERDNASSVVFREVFKVTNGSLHQAIAAACCTIGGQHAPIKDCYAMLVEIMKNIAHSDDVFLGVSNATARMKIIPGFGSSFIKGEDDPMLVPFLINLNPRWHEVIHECQVILGYRGYKLFPNLAFCTAVFALITGESLELSDRIFYEVRIPKWIELLEPEVR